MARREFNKAFAVALFDNARLVLEPQRRAVRVQIIAHDSQRLIYAELGD